MEEAGSESSGEEEMEDNERQKRNRELCQGEEQGAKWDALAEKIKRARESVQGEINELVKMTEMDEGTREWLLSGRKQLKAIRQFAVPGSKQRMTREFMKEQRRVSESGMMGRLKKIPGWLMEVNLKEAKRSGSQCKVESTARELQPMMLLVSRIGSQDKGVCASGNHRVSQDDRDG